MSKENNKFFKCINNPQIIDTRKQDTGDASLRAFMNGLEAEKHGELGRRRQSQTRAESFCDYTDIKLPPPVDTSCEINPT